MRFYRNKHKQIIAQVVLLCAVFLVSCSKQDAKIQSESATVTFIMGKVTISCAGEKAKILKVNDKIKDGAIIQTADKSCASLQINGTAVIRINENTTLDMKSILSKEIGTDLNLESGSVFSKVIKKPDTKFSVRSHTLIAAVRGTQFLTVSDENNGQVLVREGTVVVSTHSDTKGKAVTERKIIEVDGKGESKIINQTKVQELTLEQYALVPYIEDLDKKTADDLTEISKKLEAETQKFDKKIEEIKIKELSPLDRLRKEGRALTKLFLRDGSQIIGSIENTNDLAIKLNTGENIIEIPKADIKRRISVK